jgi:hypothetical protein
VAEGLADEAVTIRGLLPAAEQNAAPAINRLPSSGRVFASTPRGTAVEIPSGWTARMAENGKGLVYQRPGAVGNADMIRIMEPSAQYPNGYVRYYSSLGQPLNALGAPGAKEATHLGEDIVTTLPAWPK